MNVKCIDNGGCDSLTVGKVYDASLDNENGTVSLENDRGEEGLFCADLFECVAEEAPSVALMKKAYGKHENVSCISNYEPMVEAMGKVVHAQSVGDYQGDTRYVLKKGNQYAYLMFGWGSCSGCDSLQACDTWEDVASLYDDMNNALIWMSRDEMVAFLRLHDWEGDYGYSLDEKGDFVEKTLGILLGTGSKLDQPAPKAGGECVWPKVIEDMNARRFAFENVNGVVSSNNETIDKVVADMLERDSVGQARYGTSLRTFNGRKALVDCYQELLDAAVYLKQHAMENGDGFLCREYENLLGMATSIRLAMEE